MPWADVLYACDYAWWRKHWPVPVQSELWSVSDRARDEFGIRWLRGDPGAGLSESPAAIRTGRNSGHQAMALAALFGAARIVMLGYDMTRTGGRSHWHGDHPAGLNNGNPDGWHGEMAQLARDLQRAGVAVVNASRSTALRCFERMRLEDALA